VNENGRDRTIRFLGHATVLIETPDIRIATDPFLRERLGPLRRHGPLPDPAAIGRVDAVVVSHAHPDHFDPWSLARLEGDPLVVVPRGLGRAVRRLGRRAIELSSGDTAELPDGWTATAVPARHWRWLAAPRAPTIGYLLQRDGRDGIWFAGDTARFRGLAVMAGRVDIALLPVATWGPHLGPGHLSPRSAAETARDVGARIAVPIHWGTLYPAGLERRHGAPLTEPAARFAAWAARLAPDLDVRVLQPGEATGI
jgi:L-ascorbate metabolism protein UlaG (beta-lactamase superfamily)